MTMWHTTDETPREGAKVVAFDEDYEGVDYGTYSDGEISKPGRITSFWKHYTHWAYAPGEEA